MIPVLVHFRRLQQFKCVHVTHRGCLHFWVLTGCVLRAGRSPAVVC